ncbi:glycosyltransferase family 2 protein [Actinomarinicola tropica]|uniref:glycosyltransferase family 2 protein n=1 Tax=Actinomarinicola tropica TaxID=2789776 RepID=UPI00189C16E2|nr:glycosyltransferase family 2 protein [Actinomarinicola tropica]
MDAVDDQPGASPAPPDAAAPTRDRGGAPTAPPVTLLMVAHEPGAWFDDVLGAVAALEYPALDVVVVDAASDEPVAPRVAATLPTARTLRLEENPGFGRAIDAARSQVDVGPLVILAHDDVLPDPGAVRALVEEAFRSNAAVVGPKMTRWDDPARLLAAGEGADKFGYPVPTVERGELDQEQHDAVRDVFTVPDGFTLVRADLLDAIGGFDPDGSWFGDDLDLCWRAHVAGGRVLVAPAARVRHLEALGERRPVDDRRRLQFRHRLRAMLGAYRPLSLVRIVPQLLVVHLGEVLFALVTGRPGQARDVASAWTWNLRRLGSLRQRRRALQSVRRVPDAEIRSLQVGGSARIAAFLRGQLAVGEDPFGSAATIGRRLVDTVAGPGRRSALVAWLAVVLVLVVGSRHLLARPIPAIGELVPFPEQIRPILDEWWSSWRRAGTGSEGFAASGYLLLAAGNALLLGAAGLLRTILVLGMLPLGLLGVWRLLAPAHSVRASISGLFAYLAIPIGYDSLATGSWSGLLAYGLVPWVFARLLRASGDAPFGAPDPPAGPRVDVPPLWRQTLVLGVLVALPAAVDPIWAALPLALVVAALPGSLVAGRLRGLLRMGVTALGAGVVAVALHLPWALELASPDAAWSTFVGGRDAEVPHVPISQLLRFDTGPIGSSLLTVAVLVAAAYVLLVGRGWRLAWAARAWSVALVGWGLLWAAGMGWVPVALPPAELLLAPAAVGMALATGLGAAAFDLDVRRRGFSWRQLASLAAGVALLLAALPVVAGAVGGRWLMPRADHHEALEFLDEAAAASDQRVVWFGHPEVLPVTGWPLVDGVSYATTLDGTPVAQDLWPGHPEDDDAPLRSSIDLALDGRTSRLGRLLAPMGVEYVVVVHRAAPAPYGGASRPAPPALTAALDEQLDLERLDVNPAVTVYRNASWSPRVAVHPAGTVAEAESLLPDGARLAATTDLAATAEPLEEHGPASASADLPEGVEVLVGSTPTDGWQVEVDGADLPVRRGFGWAPLVPIDTSGEVEVGWATATSHRLVLVAQLAIVALVAVVMYLTRAEAREQRRPGRTDRRRQVADRPPARRRARRDDGARRRAASPAPPPPAADEAVPRRRRRTR